MAFIYEFHTYNLALGSINDTYKADASHFRTLLVHKLDKIDVTQKILLETQAKLRNLSPIHETSLYEAYLGQGIVPDTNILNEWLTAQFIPLFQYLFRQSQFKVNKQLDEINLSALKLSLILGGDYCGEIHTLTLMPDSDLKRFTMACRELRSSLAHTNSVPVDKIQALYDLSIILAAPNLDYQLPQQLTALVPHRAQTNHSDIRFSS